MISSPLRPRCELLESSREATPECRSPKWHELDVWAHVSHSKSTTMTTSASARHSTLHGLCKHLLEWGRTSSSTSTATHLCSEGLRKNFFNSSSTEKLTEEFVWVYVSKVRTPTSTLVHLRTKHIVMSTLACIAQTCIRCSYFLESLLSTRRSILVRMHSKCKLHWSPNNWSTEATEAIHLLSCMLFLANLLLHPFQPPEYRKNLSFS